MPPAGPGDLLEVAHEAPPVGLVVVRGDREHGVDPRRDRLLGEMTRVARVVGAGAADRRRITELGGHQRDQRALLGVGHRRRLAGRPADHEAVGAVGEQVAAEGDGRFLVDGQAVAAEWRDHGREQALVGTHARKSGRWGGSVSATR